MKKIILLSTVAVLASCTSTKPAPYEVYGTKFYGKNSTPDKSQNNYANNDYVGAPAADYNSRIDEENAHNVSSKPIQSKNYKPASVASEDSNGNPVIQKHTLAPVAIDGDQQVFKVNDSHNIHSGDSNARASRNSYQPQEAEETVPPVDSHDNFVNVSHDNQLQSKNDSQKLASINPQPKPKFTDDQQQAAATPAKAKIAAKIGKIETSSGTINKSTIGMMNKSDEQDQAEEENVGGPIENETPPPAKPAPAAVVKKVETKSVKAAPVAAAKEEPAADQQDDQASDDEEQAPAAAAPAAEVQEKKISDIKTTPPKNAPQFIKPVEGVVVSEFGSDKAGGGFNDGINIQAAEGTPVKAAGGGTVVYSGNQLQGYGNLIIIRHSNGFLTAYSHLKELELKKGDKVAQGDLVGHVGKTGNVDSPQLHFGIRKGREPVDPKDYL